MLAAPGDRLRDHRVDYLARTDHQPVLSVASHGAALPPFAAAFDGFVTDTAFKVADQALMGDHSLYTEEEIEALC